jgi:hypothetical protein
MKVTLPTEKTIVVREAETKSIKDITISTIQDFPQMKKVVAVTRELGSITLWEGNAYDSIGQWTDSNVISRIQQLYS